MEGKYLLSQLHNKNQTGIDWTAGAQHRVREEMKLTTTTTTNNSNSKRKAKVYRKVQLNLYSCWRFERVAGKKVQKSANVLTKHWRMKINESPEDRTALLLPQLKVTAAAAGQYEKPESLSK